MPRKPNDPELARVLAILDAQQQSSRYALLDHLRDRVERPSQSHDKETNHSAQPSDWLDLTEAANYLAISVSTMRRLNKAGLLPSHRIRGCIRFNRDELAACVKAGVFESTVEPVSAEPQSYPPRLLKAPSPGHESSE